MSEILNNVKRINVIVPVYNVENYLKKCIDSLLEQSYSSFCITLVDDCSTDQSGRICDYYHSRYPEIVSVIHKEKNQGLSEARNSATRISDSPWIVYVDSDDYVSKDFLKNLSDAQEKYQCDMVVTPICKEYIDQVGNSTRQEESSFHPFEYDREQALIELCYEKQFGSYAVSKLIKKDLLNKYPFPRGKLFEDSYTIYKLLFECNKIVCIPNPGYYYLQRGGSIQRSTFSKRHYDLIYACDEMIEFFMSQNMTYDLIAAGYYKLLRSCNVTCIHAIDSGNIDETYQLCKKYIAKYQYEKKLELDKRRINIKEYICFKSLIKSKKSYLTLYKINKMVRKRK